VVRQLLAEGWETSPDDLATLAPYLTEVIKHFGGTSWTGSRESQGPLTPISTSSWQQCKRGSRLSRAELAVRERSGPDPVELVLPRVADNRPIAHPLPLRTGLAGLLVGAGCWRLRELAQGWCGEPR
jgi:hypothetical protein